MKRTYKDVLEIAAVIIVAFASYQLLAFLLQTPTPILSVVSDSMEPTLHVGDLIVVATANYKPGDIAVYFTDSITIVHRIVEKQESGYKFKGDNNPVPDAKPVPKEKIAGKVYFAVPLLGYPRLFLHWIGI